MRLLCVLRRSRFLNRLGRTAFWRIVCSDVELGREGEAGGPRNSRARGERARGNVAKIFNPCRLQHPVSSRRRRKGRACCGVPGRRHVGENEQLRHGAPAALQDGHLPPLAHCGEALVSLLAGHQPPPHAPADRLRLFPLRGSSGHICRRSPRVAPVCPSPPPQRSQHNIHPQRKHLRRASCLGAQLCAAAAGARPAVLPARQNQHPACHLAVSPFCCCPSSSSSSCSEASRRLALASTCQPPPPPHPPPPTCAPLPIAIPRCTPPCPSCRI